MEKKFITIKELENQAVALVLHRKEKRNALNIALLKTFIETVKELSEKKNLRTLYLLGDGEDFCTGLDLEEALDKEKISLSSQLMEEALSVIENSPQVTVACVHGRAFGGGAGLALASDFILMEKKSTFMFPEVQRGLVPALVAALLKRKVSESYLKKLLLLGEPLYAEEALELGIALEIVEGSILEGANLIAEKVLRAGPNAVKETKTLIHTLYQSENALSIAREFHTKARLSTEAKEGVEAFLKKRSPSWTFK